METHKDNTVENALAKGLHGLHYGNRMILPFCAFFLEIIADRNIYNDFSTDGRGISILEEGNFTNIYLHEYNNLDSLIKEFEPVKLLVVDKNHDVFDFSKHRKLSLYLKSKHLINIEETDTDILFIE